MILSRLKHRCLLFILFLILSNLSCPVLEADTASENEIQAAMIIKFIDFITWPENSFDKATSPFTIGIIGKNYFEGMFEPFLGRKFQNRDFNVRCYGDIQDIVSPQILIVSVSERKRAGEILSELGGRPVLTIGDFPGFSEMGGMINFYRKPNNQIGFEINLDAQQASGLKFSSFLMKMGRIVNTEKKDRPNDWF